MTASRMASMVRASSPPEAALASGCRGSPGLAPSRKLTWSAGPSPSTATANRAEGMASSCSVASICAGQPGRGLPAGRGHLGLGLPEHGAGGGDLLVERRSPLLLDLDGGGALPGVGREGQHLGEVGPVLALELVEQLAAGADLLQTLGIVVPGLDHRTELGAQIGRARPWPTAPGSRGRPAGARPARDAGGLGQPVERARRPPARTATTGRRPPPAGARTRPTAGPPRPRAGRPRRRPRWPRPRSRRSGRRAGRPRGPAAGRRRRGSADSSAQPAQLEAGRVEGAAGRCRRRRRGRRRWASVWTRDRCWCWPCSSIRPAAASARAPIEAIRPSIHALERPPADHRPGQHDLARRRPSAVAAHAVAGVGVPRRPEQVGADRRTGPRPRPRRRRPAPPTGRPGPRAAGRGPPTSSVLPAPVSPVRAVIPGPRATVTSSMTPRLRTRSSTRLGPTGAGAPTGRPRWNLARRMAWKSRVPKVTSRAGWSPSRHSTVGAGLEGGDGDPVDHQHGRRGARAPRAAAAPCGSSTRGRSKSMWGETGVTTMARSRGESTGPRAERL